MNCPPCKTQEAVLAKMSKAKFVKIPKTTPPNELVEHIKTIASEITATDVFDRWGRCVYENDACRNMAYKMARDRLAFNKKSCKSGFKTQCEKAKTFPKIANKQTIDEFLLVLKRTVP